MNQRGFTLIEMMVVIAIIAILSSVAIPGYQNYIRKAALIDILRTITTFKTGVELCGFSRPAFAGCSSGQETIPAEVTGRYIKNISVVNGAVRFQGNGVLDALKLTMTPARAAGGMTEWTTVCDAKEPDLKQMCQSLIQ